MSQTQYGEQIEHEIERDPRAHYVDWRATLPIDLTYMALNLEWTGQTTESTACCDEADTSIPTMKLYGCSGSPLANLILPVAFHVYEYWPRRMVKKVSVCLKQDMNRRWESNWHKTR